MTIVAVSCRTESGDSYLFLEHIDQIVQVMQANMYDEIEYISEFDVQLYPVQDSAILARVEEAINAAIGG